MTEQGIHDEDVLGKAYDGRLMRRLLTYVRPYRPLVAGALFFLFTEGALQLVGPLLTKRVIDIAVPAHDIPLVKSSVILLAVALVAQFGCSYGETILTALLGQRVMHDLRGELFAHLQRLPIPFYDRNPVGRLITRVTTDVESLNELFTAGVVSGLGDLFTLVAISVAMFWVDWRLAIAGYATIPFVFLVSHLFRKSVRESYREVRTRIARINAFLQERLTGMRVVQLFGRERDEARRFDRLNRDHLDANLASITVYALYFPAIELLTTIALAILVVDGAHRLGIGALTVGTVAAFLQLLRRFFQPLQDLSEKYNILQQAMAASERIFTLLDTPVALGTATTQGAAAAIAPANVRAEGARRGVDVRFEDVWFAYQEPEWVLRGVSFHVARGETLAIVGHTGAGKTTIVSLLLRFYEPQRGRITVDGVDIRDMSLETLRELVGYVQQDIFLFAGDVATNIRLSNPLSDEQVVAAATRVGADRVVQRLPGAYSYELGERGASVSVGERQLLSFARAIAADPALLVLDEATSAVDSEIEAQIQRAIAELMRGRTTIAIAHRLSTIVGSDRILVLHLGEVREQGTHAELLEKRGLYERLYRLQAGLA
jgi:ATP-binding cassette subfamily B protein